MAERPLGRRVPTSFEHVSMWPLRAATPASVERTLRLPGWHWTHDQGEEGSCVGHAVAMERSICNTAQNRLLALLRPGRRYDPIDVWEQAKIVDEWPDTNPGDQEGTSVSAAYDVMRDMGPRRVRGMRLVEKMIDGRAVMVPAPTVVLSGRDAQAGVAANRWATSVDEVRAALAAGSPVTIGVFWYSAFDSPVRLPTGFAKQPEWWVAPNGADLGWVRGGHAVCVYGASDRRQAVKFKNSWGKDYPLCWMPYDVLGKLLEREGEAAIVTDR